MAANLMQKLKLGNKVQQHIFRAVLYFALVICAGMFASQLNEQAKRNDANANLKLLQTPRDGKPSDARLLENPEITYLYCPEKYEIDSEGTLDASPCDASKPVVLEKYLANITKVPEVKNAQGQVVKRKNLWTKVDISLSNDEINWLRDIRSTFVVLAMPRYAHYRTYVVGIESKNIVQAGFASDTTITLRVSDLLERGKLELYVRVGELPLFGPTDVAAHLVRPNRVADFLGLLDSQREASSLARQLELALPVMLAAIAIILDHSVVMSYLSLYAASRAVHDYIGFQFELGRIPQGSSIDYFYFVSVGTGFAFLVLFTATIVNLNVRRIKLAYRWLFVIVMGALFGMGKFFDPSFSTTSDLWGDSLAVISCFLVIGYAGFEWVRNPPSPEMKASNPESYSRSSVALVVTRLVIVCTALGVHGWVNIRDLIGHSTNAEMKSRLDWKTMILMPSLMTAALLEVGSTAKKMLNFGRDMAAKALIEQELNVGREVQARMLPNLRTTTDSWHWRAFYFPAEALAGDWFDIRELKFPDGRTLLVACVADVTGHGVGSSLATSVICSHWGLWCSRLLQSGFPETPEAKQQELKRAPHGIHLGLKALRENENCTAIFAIFDPIRDEITFSSAGHPGILVIGNKSFRYFTTQGERLGGDVPTDFRWNAKTEVLTAGDLVVLYSDGVVPLRATVSSWAAQIKRKAVAGAIEKPELMMIKQLWENKRGFVDAHDLKDDMTLVMVRRNVDGAAKVAVPEPGQDPQVSSTSPDSGSNLPHSA